MESDGRKLLLLLLSSLLWYKADRMLQYSQQKSGKRGHTKLNNSSRHIYSEQHWEWFYRGLLNAIKTHTPKQCSPWAPRVVEEMAHLGTVLVIRAGANPRRNMSIRQSSIEKQTETYNQAGPPQEPPTGRNFVPPRHVNSTCCKYLCQHNYSY